MNPAKTNHNRLFWGLMLAVLLCRLVIMAVLPLTDPSEARYAEIARVMAESHDWITPWFAPGVPFWGKPPAAFWVQALAMETLGVSEFAVRLPALLASLLTMLILFAFVRGVSGDRMARWTLLIYSSSILPFVMAGAVLTDPFLVLGTTWIMAALIMAPRSRRWYWRYGLFLGTAIGLLAKGPLVLVLSGGAVLPWLIFSGQAVKTLRAQPWLIGTLLTLVLTLPWYIAADIKTPGFLYYFLVGEHLLRFIEPGWSGDLYGGAHDRAHGTIWLYYLGASFPWGLWLIAGLARMARRRQVTALGAWLRQPLTLYLLGWALFTPVFFTLSGNILWTYILPALPAFSFLVAGLVLQNKPAAVSAQSKSALLIAVVPVVMLVVSLALVHMPERIKSEKPLVAYLNQLEGLDKLVFLGEPTYSMQFYSAGAVAAVSAQDWQRQLGSGVELPQYIATRPKNEAALEGRYTPVMHTKSISLFRLEDEKLALDRVQKPPVDGGTGEG